MGIKYITVEDILEYHEVVIEETGGKKGIYPDGEGKLKYILDEIRYPVFGKMRFRTLISKAARILYLLTLEHAFIDGNKRTAFLSTVSFLEINGYRINASYEEIIEYTVAIAEHKVSFEDVKAWLKQHCVKIEK